jgi:hypothetical protein
MDLVFASISLMVPSLHSEAKEFFISAVLLLVGAYCNLRLSAPNK